VGAILWAVQVPDARRAEPVRPTPSPTPAVSTRLQAGSISLTVPVAYPSSPVLVRVEPGSGGDVARFNRIPDEGGISIFENVVPVRDKAGHRDPTAGDDAREMAEWLAERPFLVDTHVVAVSVGDMTGWRVESRLPNNLKGTNALPPGGKQTEVLPVLRSGNAFVRYGPAVGDMTFVDVPRAGVVAIWTWNPFGDLRMATEPAMRDFVSELRFGG
jgi:hypothetical protein